MDRAMREALIGMNIRVREMLTALGHRNRTGQPGVFGPFSQAGVGSDQAAGFYIHSHTLRHRYEDLAEALDELEAARHREDIHRRSVEGRGEAAIRSLTLLVQHSTLTVESRTHLQALLYNLGLDRKLVEAHPLRRACRGPQPPRSTALSPESVDN